MNPNCPAKMAGPNSRAGLTHCVADHDEGTLAADRSGQPPPANEPAWLLLKLALIVVGPDIWQTTPMASSPSAPASSFDLTYVSGLTDRSRARCFPRSRRLVILNSGGEASVHNRRCPHPGGQGPIAT